MDEAREDLRHWWGKDGALPWWRGMVMVEERRKGQKKKKKLPLILGKKTLEQRVKLSFTFDFKDKLEKFWSSWSNDLISGQKFSQSIEKKGHLINTLTNLRCCFGINPWDNVINMYVVIRALCKQYSCCQGWFSWIYGLLPGHCFLIFVYRIVDLLACYECGVQFLILIFIRNGILECMLFCSNVVRLGFFFSFLRSS